MMTALDLEFERALHFHEWDMKVIMIMDYRLWLQGLYVFIQCPPLRPLSTQPTTRKYKIPSLPSCPDDPGMTCPSGKGSAGT